MKINDDFMEQAETRNGVNEEQAYRNLFAAIIRQAVVDYAYAVQAGYIQNGRLVQRPALRPGNRVFRFGGALRTWNDVVDTWRFFHEGGVRNLCLYFGQRDQSTVITSTLLRLVSQPDFNAQNLPDIALRNN